MGGDDDKITGLYERHALSFDRERGRSLFERPWLDRFTALIRPQGTILDIGCGMGEPISAALIADGFRLTGIDSSQTLIDLCRKRFAEHSWIVSDMRTLALARTFDGIIAWHSFFHLDPDSQRRMFPIFAAHARPGAPLMFTAGPSHGVAIGEYHGEPLYHASLDAEEYRSLLAECGFEVVSHVVEDPDCGGATVWLARRRA
ncbi:class I SAM-dependent methyltransferase [Sinorhizobium sp. BG8]|uniref:class I SAM-dependent DNA methyltransferase n=1 Tax=Sinorhizobium sp. BG8 TaxID=2613773 RepID=UPI00193D23B1|nr:class I SAM-dependent methyltransferase [Sinorhizobium sp. BG8]QRM54458.1 class I SAM-dependent methyltransferase [Sinorhizobium sp. BG8]